VPGFRLPWSPIQTTGAGGIRTPTRIEQRRVPAAAKGSLWLVFVDVGEGSLNCLQFIEPREIVRDAEGQRIEIEAILDLFVIVPVENDRIAERRFVALGQFRDSIGE